MFQRLQVINTVVLSVLFVAKCLALMALLFYFLAVRHEMIPKSICIFKILVDADRALVLLDTFVGALRSDLDLVATLRTPVFGIGQ